MGVLILGGGAAYAADTVFSADIVDGEVNDKVSGGGFVLSNGAANVPNVAVQRNYAVSSGTWLVRGAASSGTPTWGITVVANCIK